MNPMLQFIVHVVLAGAFLLVIIYSPLLPRELPPWARILAIATGLLLVASGFVAVHEFHRPP